jgi:VWFA-related protein
MIRQIILAWLLVGSVISSGIAQNPTQPSPQSQTTQPQPSSQSNQSRDDHEDVVRITTNLVQVDAVVTKDGKVIKDLQKEDFEIFEDGRRQEITSFAYIANVPGAASSSGPRVNAKDKNAPPLPGAPLQPHDPRRTIALVIDDLGLSAESMAQVRRQLRKFVDEQLSPNDLVAIIRTGGQMGALQQFTNDRRLIEKAMSQVKWNLCSRVGINVFPTVPLPLLRQQTRSISEGGPCGLYSVGNTMRALTFIVEAMDALPGRKSMIVFSDDLPRQDQEIDLNRFGDRADVLSSGASDTRNYSFLLRRIAERAIRSSVVIYSVDAGGLHYTGITAADNISGNAAQINSQVLNTMTYRSRLIQQRREGAELIANQTGGFLVRNSNNFQLDRILEDQSGYYLLGYRPTDETFNKRFHKIKARVKKSGMTLRTRFGFYGITEEDANRTKLTPADKSTLALMSPFGAQDIEVDLTTFFAHSKATGPLIRSFLYINAKDLTFSETADGSHNASIELRAMIFGSNGIVVDQTTVGRNLSLRGNTYEQALREGITVQFDTPVKKPGAYQFRVAARDMASSRIGSAGQFVAVPDLNNKQLALSGIVMRGVSKTADETAPNAAPEPGTNPAVRRFAVGSNVQFVCAIYNALLDPARGLPNLVMQARLFRDDKSVYSSPEMTVDTSDQTDLTHLVAPGVVRLSSSLEPGTYFLQVVVTDMLAREKQEPVMQWIDFEVVKRP